MHLHTKLLPQNYGDQYRDVFKVLAKRENYPVICHCRAGADRAGTVSALLEAIIGCSEKQMAEDYQWTSLSVYGIRDSLSSMWKETISEIKSYDTISGTVQLGAWNYLLAKGVSSDELSAIRRIMLGHRVQPFNGVSQSSVNNRHALPVNGAVRRILSGSDRICIPCNIEKIAVYSLSGKKIFSFHRSGKTGDLNVLIPGTFHGIGIIRFVIQGDKR